MGMLLDDVNAYLTAMGAGGGLTGWTIFEAYLPDDQDQVVAVFATGGYPATEINRETENLTCQVRVRGKQLDYAGTYAKWEEVFNLLQDARQTSGTPILLPNVVFFQAQHYGPADIGLDAYKRHNLTMNFRVKRIR